MRTHGREPSGGAIRYQRRVASALVPIVSYRVITSTRCGQARSGRERAGSVVDSVIADRFGNVLAKGRDLLSHHIKSRERTTWIDSEPYSAWRSQSLTLLQVAFGSEHVCVRTFEQETSTERTVNIPQVRNAEAGLGTLRAAAEDYAKGYTWTFKERVHAEVFDDYLEMATQFLADGYTTAGAVVAGSTLEEHLRKLCQKHGIVTHLQGKPKKGTVLNDELLKQSVHLQGEWRSIQSWFDIRNDAAHNPQTKYSKQEVEQMIDGIRGFIARHPA
jgi:hypothetical protein